MPKFLIERNMPGAGKLSTEELSVLAERSCRAIAELGAQIQWLESFITADRVYSVYIASSESIIRKHASMSGIPADAISEVKSVMDPSTSWRAHWEEEHDMSKEAGIY